MPDDDLTSLAFQAYLYGFPLVFNLDQVRRFVTTGAGSTPQAPYNRLSHSRGLAGPEDTPATQDQPRQKSLSATGIDQRGPSPYVSPQASFADTLRQGIAVVESTLKRALESGGSSPEVNNEINRYSIGDRTPGIVYADDGSLTITISRSRPADPTAAANWLPAPSSDFRPVLRMYEPAPEVLDQTYSIPPITRVS